jgi:tetratricopeptide (TPR) repeat protein
MRDRRILPIIAILLLLGGYLLASSSGPFWMIGKSLFDFLPAPFNHIAYFGMVTVLSLLLLLASVVLSTYHRYSTRAAARRASEAATPTKIGKELFANGEYESAVRAFTAAIQCDPSSAYAFINRGGSYYHLGKLDEALADLDRAISLKPRSWRP